jgi:nicotinamidase-related amidase
MRGGLVFILVLFLFAAGNPLTGQKSALLLIDIQEYYFPGGGLQLENSEIAGMNAGLLLEQFRNNGLRVYHVVHDFEAGGNIHHYVQPHPGEIVISKDRVNPFLETGLMGNIRADSIRQLVICGMQTHMCVEAAVRAAHDLGISCLLVSDACATRALQFEDHIVPAKNVHYSTLGTLEGTYARVVSTQELLRRFNEYVK